MEPDLKKIFIVGINDFMGNIREETVFKNYQQIVTNLTNKNIQVYVISTIISGERLMDINPLIIELNNHMRAFCYENGIAYLDVNTNVSKNGLLNSDYSFDDVHLNGEGLIIFKRIIAQYL